MNAAKTPTAVRHFPVIRVFVSSTFDDLVAERNALAEHVWPELERYCRQRGFTFQAIDLRWGVPGEAGLDHRTMQICFEELRRAQETSPEPNFLILLGNKYGWRPLPETISEAEYACLRSHALSPDEQSTLAAWYRRDANARPTHYVLRARTDSPDGQDYTRVPDADGRLRDTAAWLAVQETLWTIVNRAYPGTLMARGSRHSRTPSSRPSTGNPRTRRPFWWPWSATPDWPWRKTMSAQRFTEEVDHIPTYARFQGSATEQEIWHGALLVENARDHVVAWFREIDRAGGDPEKSQLKRFLDLQPDQSPDLDAAAALDQLKTRVEQKLAPEPILHAECRWETDANGEFTGEVTTDHLAPMCEALLTRLRTLVLRQIDDYWSTDLSAENATVAVVRGSQHELDLELRDHRRFAQERGPLDLFVGRDEQVLTIREYLQANTNRPFIVHGPSGSGKTALLAYVAQQHFLPGADAGDVSPLILTRFIGAHPESSTLRGLMTSLCRELRVHFPTPEPLPDTLPKLIEEFYTQLARATDGQPIYVFLDALDQLEATDQARECLWLRSQLVSQAGESLCNARIVASCLSPSPEFPLESEACDPFRRLRSRGLLADEELGALGETAAGHLLRRWCSGAG